MTLTELRNKIDAAEELHIANGILVDIAVDALKAATAAQNQSRRELMALRQQLIERERLDALTGVRP